MNFVFAKYTYCICLYTEDTRMNLFYTEKTRTRSKCILRIGQTSLYNKKNNASVIPANSTLKETAQVN
jgi:hypothetical protein